MRKENKILSENADTAFQDGLNEAQELYREQVKSEISAKAIKEFAERLKDMHRHNTTSVVSLVTVYDNINNLIKEMVGGG